MFTTKELNAELSRLSALETPPLEIVEFGYTDFTPPDSEQEIWAFRGAKQNFTSALLFWIKTLQAQDWQRRESSFDAYAGAGLCKSISKEDFSNLVFVKAARGDKFSTRARCGRFHKPVSKVDRRQLVCGFSLEWPNRHQLYLDSLSPKMGTSCRSLSRHGVRATTRPAYLFPSPQSQVERRVSSGLPIDRRGIQDHSQSRNGT